ncbi:barstar family protein [Herbaspirillum rubrisubalbicans]|uniref:barstar family protein n=1 Tax=Herbaspirillum rubrisubalbicans TaxID=80842 RepID=UPI0009E9AFC6|nr:barstar family protein [Herbaspirillum rubrisubalbicans]
MTEKNEVYIDGRLIQTELDFHRAISSALDFVPYYGNNLDALWDLLSAGVAGGVTLHWENSDVSKKRLGRVYDTIVRLFTEINEADERLNVDERFVFFLE